ncbi:hypothetical protein KY362_05200 [Candidatus Woesearchaeota archaeon]|nr:hypothetical protein [Candidatus Woesearchaeota archaeon]
MGEAKKTLFEMVCTANHGRSPVAELVGRIYLVDRGVSGAYDTISSGSLADAIKARKVSPAARDRFVKLAMERGDVLTSGEVSAYQKAEKVGDHMKMDELYWKVADRFQHEEHEHRSEAMK